MKDTKFQETNFRKKISYKIIDYKKANNEETNF